VRTLFIDFDGTICHDRFWRGLKPDEYTQVQNILFSGKNTLVADWMRGRYSSEEINRAVEIETSLPYDYLWQVFVSDCETMFVDPKIIELIQVLRKRYHVVLITGNMDCFTRFTVPALKLEASFDEIVNSYYEGQLKTENAGATFVKYTKGDISEAILIEDSTKSCEAFRLLGGTAYQVTIPKDTLKFLQNLP
jgi:FMN phosphatase YigB (HAD superfamily)